MLIFIYKEKNPDDGQSGNTKSPAAQVPVPLG
jgi:hypothetical protein